MELMIRCPNCGEWVGINVNNNSEIEITCVCDYTFLAKFSVTPGIRMSCEKNKQSTWKYKDKYTGNLFEDGQ